MNFRTVYLKSQIVAVLGSIADYLTVIVLVEIFRCWYIPANLLGNLAGGSFQFILGRKWVFKTVGDVNTRILKFILFFSGNLILSAAGVYLLTSLLLLNYLVSKTAVSVFLGLTYNYYVQKSFVFSSVNPSSNKED